MKGYHLGEMGKKTVTEENENVRETAAFIWPLGGGRKTSSETVLKREKQSFGILRISMDSE